jgi:glycyl-tRNA synthetase beta chain
MIGNNDSVERTALLAKADLATKLVFEFTELQGFIGADYARVSGETEQVSEGIKEHYFPLNADGEIAKTLEGQIVGIADKIDNICAVFAEGKKPTGSSDPLGVRRASLGIIRTILSSGLKINVAELIKDAIKLLPISNIDEKIIGEIYEFFIQRLVIFLSDKYSKNILEACASNKNPLVDLADYMERVETVSKLNSPALLESANRVLRMLKSDSSKSVDKSLFKEEAEANLFEQIKTVDAVKYDEYLNQLERINPAVEKFFNDVLVMDKDENVKENRLALLTLLKSKYNHLADFSKL